MGHVLVVDDHRDSCRMLVAVIRAAGHDGECVDDGAAALAAARARLPDLVFLDVLMPGLGGLDVLARLRADPATAAVPVVLYTAKDDDNDRRLAAQLGATRYLVKSAARFGELEAAVHDFLPPSRPAGGYGG